MAFNAFKDALFPKDNNGDVIDTENESYDTSDLANWPVAPARVYLNTKLDQAYRCLLISISKFQFPSIFSTLLSG